MSDFGKASGPTSGPRAPNPYLHLQQHRPSPPPSQISPRNFEASQSIYSPPLAFRSNYSAVGPSHPPAAVLRSFDPRTHQRPSVSTPSLPSKNQGAYFPAKTAPLDYFNRARPSQVQSTDEDSARNSSRRDTRPSGVVFDGRLQSASKRISPPLSPGNHYPRDTVGAFVEVQRQRPPGPLFDDDIQPVPQRTRPPGPLFDDDIQPVPQRMRTSGLIFNDHVQSIPQRTRSPPEFPGKGHTGERSGPSVEPRTSVLSSPVWSNQTNATSNFGNTWFGQDQSPQNSRRQVSITRVDTQASKQTRSPSVNVQDNPHFSRHGLISWECC